MGIVGPNYQRDILNAMNQELRKEVLRQLDGKATPQAQHPDSVTGLTLSACSEQPGLAMEESNVTSSGADDVSVQSQLCGNLPTSGALASCPCRTAALESDETCVHEGPPSIDVSLEDLYSDSDGGGGVLL